MICYFDNSATTRPSNLAIEAVNRALLEEYGNPSALYPLGDSAKLLLEESRKTVAKALSCDSKEIYFTSGGTESNNLAIFGTLSSLKKRGGKIITTKIEHKSVGLPIEQLKNEGFDVAFLSVDSQGNFDAGELEALADDKTVFVSIMSVNNETGAILPVSKVKPILNKKNSKAIVHCDAIQAFGKMQIYTEHADIISLSSHKIHGPKGAGGIFIKSGVRVKPIILGGGQERELRSGTEAIPAILGFAAAVKEIDFSYQERIKVLNKLVREELQKISNVHINSSESALENILNVSFVGIPSEVMRNLLSEKDIFVSVGSSCTRGKRSYVLEEIINDKKIIDSAIRISFSKYNTLDEAQYFLEIVRKINGRYVNTV